MDTTTLKKFAQGARRQLLEQVSARMEQVLRTDSVEIREKAKVVEQLKAEIEAHGKLAVIDRVAYTWFNRFCALRFMDVNHYTRIGAVSPVEGGTQPEVLLEAKQGHVDEELARFVNPQVIFSLLNGQRPASDPQGEAYRLLLVGVCNSYSEVMPFLFEKIEDYTELLMPLDLLSENSVLHDLREALTPEACQDVEVIGWLYQYYISERKDKVFEALKQNQKIEAGDIPAATQLFTPHWIVRYLVENSLGRLWMLNHPNSGLREKMEYYIENDEGGMMNAESIHQSSFIILNSPEEIKLLDPACGSGHILTYAFDLLAAIYEEEGYASSDVAKLILEKNLFGVEIDPRAGALAAFALVMKARAKDRRIFTRTVSPNICVLENVTFNDAELKQYMNAVGRDLFTEPLMETLRQFEQADNFGSLIRPMLTDAGYVRGLLEGKNLGGDLFLFGVHERVLKVLKQAEYLAPRYYVVVANPPYMGGGGMNDELRDFSKDYFPDSKSDLFAMFIERGFDLTVGMGYNAMVTMQSWMFLSSYEELRLKLFKQVTIISLIHMANMVMGIAFGTSATVWKKHYEPAYKSFFNFVEYKDLTEENRPKEFPVKNARLAYSSTNDFIKIPGSPVSYWVSEKMRNIFASHPHLGTLFSTKQGIATGDNEKYVRYWFEVDLRKTNFNASSTDIAQHSRAKWFPYSKGGTVRRWYGNAELVVNWQNDGEGIKNNRDKSGKLLSRPQNLSFQFLSATTWTLLSNSTMPFMARWRPNGYVFDINGMSAFGTNEIDAKHLTALLNTPFSNAALKIINPTLAFQSGDISRIPLPSDLKKIDISNAMGCIELAKLDWDSYETSWDFIKDPLIILNGKSQGINSTCESLFSNWHEKTIEIQKLEEENNRIFIEAYELDDELSFSVPLREVTLTRNPYYRYGDSKTEAELKSLLLADTMKEFISYAVGCMFGRYSLDKPGLVLANQGETLKDYLRKVGSGEWIVDSKGEKDDDSSQLQRVDRLAESNESSGKRVSGNETISKGRTLRSDESSQAFGGVDSIEHSGRTSQKINGGISEFLVNCERFKSRDGDPNPACPALELCNERYRQSNSQSIGRSKPITVWADEQSEVTPHCPLSTIHFLPDEDNVIPVLEGEWFEDDIAERFKKFLRVTFGEEHYDENLAFIEEAIGRDVRSYFVKEFYKDHVQTYKKRPIYWMFSSPKGSFNALIYMHRYQPDTVSIVLNGYLREYIKKLTAHKSQLERTSVSGSASQSQKTKALKEIQQVNKVLSELKEYEDDVLYPLATERVSIDLDDGVKVNYGKFGAALSPIKGL